MGVAGRVRADRFRCRKRLPGAVKWWMSAGDSGGFPGRAEQRGAHALVDGECPLQVRGGLGGVAFSEVSVADSFQGACFFWGRADVAGDGQRPGVLAVGLAGYRGAQRELAETVQRFGLAEQVAEAAEQFEGLLVAGGGGRVVPGLLLHQAEVVEGLGLAEPVTEVAEQRQGLLLAGRGGRVVPGLLLNDTQGVESLSLAFQVAEVTE